MSWTEEEVKRLEDELRMNELRMNLDYIRMRHGLPIPVRDERVEEKDSLKITENNS